jgi:hypothetical protein
MFPPPRNRKKPQRKNRSRPILMGLALVLAVIALFLLGSWLLGSKNTTLKPLALRFEATDAYAATSESILFIKDDKLTCIDYANNEKWSAALLASGMKISASQSLCAAFDGTRVQLFTSSGGPLSSKEFYGSVTQVRCGQTLTAVLNADFENQNRVILLNKSGTEVGRYQFTGKYILDFGFYEGDSFYIYMLDGGSVVPVSRLMTYNKDLANTGNLSVENQILQHPIFLKDKLYAVGTNQIIQMDYVGTRAGEKLIYGWEYIDHIVTKGDNATFLMVPGGEPSSHTVISTARILQIGTSDVFAQMPSATVAVSLGTNRLYAYTAGLIRVLNLKGETQSEHKLPFSASGFVPLPTKKHALCIVGKAVHIVKLP